MGLSFSPLSEAVMGAVAGARQGQASGSYNTLRELGGVFGVAILGAVFQRVAPAPMQFLAGFHAAVFAGAVVLAVGAVAALLLPRRSAQSRARLRPPRRLWWRRSAYRPCAPRWCYRPHRESIHLHGLAGTSPRLGANEDVNQVNGGDGRPEKSSLVAHPTRRASVQQGVTFPKHNNQEA